MMDHFVIELAQYGALGIVAGVSLFAYIRLSNKLIDLIEKHTRAFEQLTAVITASTQARKNK
jgi:hypothetical protein